MREDEGKSPDQLMHEIDQTRADIRQTLDALGERITVGELVTSAITPARESTLQFARGFGRAVQDNPVAFALTGVGLAWLMASRGRGEPSAHDVGGDWRREPSRPQTAYAEDAEVMRAAAADPDYIRETEVGTEAPSGPSARERVAETASEAARKAGEAARSAREWARDAGERARRTSDTVGRTAGEAYRRTSEAYHRTSEAAGRAGTRARTVARSSTDYVREHPLVTAAAVVGIGAAIAVMLARTARGRRVVSRYGEDIRERGEALKAAGRDAAAAGREAAERARSAAAATAQAAREQVSERLKKAQGGPEPAHADLRGPGEPGKADWASLADAPGAGVPPPAGEAWPQVSPVAAHEGPSAGERVSPDAPVLKPVPLEEEETQEQKPPESKPSPIEDPTLRTGSP